MTILAVKIALGIVIAVIGVVAASQPSGGDDDVRVTIDIEATERTTTP